MLKFVTGMVASKKTFKKVLIILQPENSVSIANRVFKHPYLFVACGFGVGLIRPGPGTWGTLLALPMHYLLSASL